MEYSFSLFFLQKYLNSQINSAIIDVDKSLSGQFTELQPKT